MFFTSWRNHHSKEELVGFVFCLFLSWARSTEIEQKNRLQWGAQSTESLRWYQCESHKATFTPWLWEQLSCHRSWRALFGCNKSVLRYSATLGINIPALSLSLTSLLFICMGHAHSGSLYGSNIMHVKWPRWTRAVHRPLQPGKRISGKALCQNMKVTRTQSDQYSQCAGQMG